MKEVEENIKFKIELDVLVPIPRTVTHKFTTLKHLRQWQKRNDVDSLLTCFAYREYLLNDKGKWERFIVIGKQIKTISELESIVRQLKNEGFNDLTPQEYVELRSSCAKL